MMLWWWFLCCWLGRLWLLVGRFCWVMVILMGCIMWCCKKRFDVRSCVWLCCICGYVCIDFFIDFDGMLCCEIVFCFVLCLFVVVV